MPIEHFTLPLRVVNGQYATAGQDTPEDVETRVEAVLRYQRETLPFLPEFGRPDVLFKTNPTGDQIRQAVRRWEPHIDVLTDDVLEGAARRVRVSIGTLDG